MNTINHKEPINFLHGGGEMGALTRNYDWSNTSLNLPEHWPQSLQTTLGILLHSSFPMFLFWGKDLICFYNDAFRPSLGKEGKHPALGKKGKEVWFEIWDFIGPLINKVIATGEPVYFEDQLVPFYRNGKLEDIYWTFSYSPAYGDNGLINGVFVTCTETTGKVYAAKQLAESEQNLRNMILQAPVAMCILKGPEYIVEIANDRMISLWGKPGIDIMHKPLFSVLPEIRDQGFDELLNQVYTTGKTVRLFERNVNLFRSRKLENIYVNFTYEAFKEGDGRISGIMVIATEVTEQIRARQKIEEAVTQRTKELAEANEALRNSNIELKRSNQNLEEFAHAASHDLKEPIRKIHYFADMLKVQLAGKLNENELKSFQRIENSTNRMARLIDDLLLYSFVNQQPFEKESVDLNLKLKLILEDLELAIQEKEANVHIGDLPSVYGYRKQLQQLFQNLISNALKFSKANVAPQISITSTIAEEDGKRYHLIIVEDNGIGFQPEYSEKIFQIFTRLHGRGEYSGTGVGLSIVKKVIENHNGMIRVTSVPQKGSTFKVYIPII